MYLVCLWVSWKAPDGNILETFTILTTAANKPAAPIHDRMPVTLHLDMFKFWLSHNMHVPEQQKTITSLSLPLK